MDAIDRSIRERLHRAGAEMAARPLRADDATGVHAPRSLRPLVAAVALAAAVGGIAGGLSLHSRLGAHQGGPAATPPPAGASPAASTPAATPAYAAAPFISMFNAVQTTWDSTHEQVVSYIAASPKTSTGNQIYTWDGRWHQVDASGGPGINDQGLWLDDPALHGQVLVGGNARMDGSNWLWDGRAWHALPTTPTQDCMAPAQGAFDAQRNQLVVLFSDQCSGGNVVSPTETWTLDGRTWHQHADTPGNGPSEMAWDADAGAVVMLGPDGSGKARAWTWTGSTWSRGPASTVAWPEWAAGAAWDRRTGGVVVYADRPRNGSAGAARAIAYRHGTFTELPQTGAPMNTQGVFADTSYGHLLALGQEPQPASATPAPWDGDKEYYVIEWTGTTWTPLLGFGDLHSVATP